MRLALRLLPIVLGLSSIGCGEDERLLFVELRTDLLPGVEFVSIRTSIAAPSRTTTSAASLAQDFLAGERVAELGDIPPGSLVVRVALLDAADEVVAERRVRLDFESTVGVTILVTRDCRGVACDASATCVGGLCASVECHEELRPEACGVRECTSPSDCGAAVSSCAAARCELGSCLFAEAMDACSAMEYCDVDLGCRGRPGPVDAGPLDATPRDAAADAAADASDGGPDAGDTSADAGSTGGTRIGAGVFHTCTTRPDGRVSCWGIATGGTLGEGSATGIAVSARPVSGLSDAVLLSAGPYHTCATRVTGTLVCWGRNSSGQLGDGTFTDALTPTPTTLANVALVEVGRDWSCAVTAGGGAFCWGANDWGQLGDRTTTNRSLPVLVPGVDAALGIAISDTGTCVRQASGVTCFGLGYFGDGRQTNDPTARATPPLPSNLQNLVAGANHFCALLMNGEVRCWGDNGFGQVGVSGGLSTSPQVVAVPSSREIWAGAARTCVRARTGDIYCWGRNSRGQLGDGTMIDASSPIRVRAFDAAESLALGAEHTCFSLGADVYCVGWNSSGQLGDGTTTTRLIPSMVILD